LQLWTDTPRGNRWHGPRDVSEMAALQRQMQEGRRFSEEVVTFEADPFMPPSQAFHYAWAKEVFQCVRPGAHLVAFGSPRTYHRLVCGIEDAGFEIRDTICWLHGQGFPKHSNALKPAMEPICLARRPLEGTVAANTLCHGCGGLNVDAARIPADWANDPSKRGLGYGYTRKGDTTPATFSNAPRTEYDTTKGRWPANVVLSDDPEVEAAFAAFGTSTSTDRPRHNNTSLGSSASGIYGKGSAFVGAGHADTGSPSRFFYTCKADARDRAGSRHPTVKPTDLMRWLVRLVCPANGIVLDPFAGSGSTGLAADQCGMRSVLVERDPTYAGDALRKIREDAPLFAEPAGPVPDLDAAYQRQTGDLFAEVEP
jgi:site-specific DNA-methyltransferase (adenine-specific)